MEDNDNKNNISPDETPDNRNDKDECNETQNDESGNNEPEVTGDGEAVVEEKHSVVYEIFDYLEIFVFSICAVLIIFSFFTRLCRVNGDSMNETLNNGEMLIVSDVFYTPKTGDIIVFHQTGSRAGDLNEPLVKRVIAAGGQTLKVDFKNGTVYVDGVLVEDANSDDTYVHLDNNYDLGSKNTYYSRPFMSESGKYLDEDGCYVREVPEGYVFVMGDNRNNSRDSRFADIGFVDERRILGHVLLRLNPFTTFD